MSCARITAGALDEGKQEWPGREHYLGTQHTVRLSCPVCEISRVALSTGHL